MLRRRTAGLVLDPRDDPKANHPIVANTRSFSYASAPIISGGVAIGTVHGDMHFSGRRVDVVDRDSLGAFASNLGSLVEKALLVDRLHAQRGRARTLPQASDDLIREFSDGDIRIGSPRPAAHELEVSDPPYVDSPLSGREREVLALLAGGATSRPLRRHGQVTHQTHLPQATGEQSSRSRRPVHPTRTASSLPHPMTSNEVVDYR